MNVVITGASGFVGKFLTKKLSTEANKVICLGRSEESLDQIPMYSNVETHVTDYSISDLEAAMSGYDTLIHLAGRRLTHSDDPLRVSPFTNATMETLDNLLAAAAKNDFKRVVNTSSIGAYSAFNEAPYSELDIALPATPYGLTKLFTEQAIDFWSRKTGISAAHVRLTQCYGYGEKWTPVLMRFIKNAINGENLTVNDSGFSLDQIYIKDTVSAFVLLAQSEKKGRFNIGSGESLTLLEMAETVKKVFNTTIAIDLARDNPSPGQHLRHMNILKAKNELNWCPQYDLEKGLHHMKKIMDSQ